MDAEGHGGMPPPPQPPPMQLRGNSKDVGWNYGKYCDPDNKTKVKCDFCGHISTVAWWKRYGSEVPYMQKMAIRIMALTSSSSGCERNWSIYEMIHTKRRNRLTTDRLNNMVYVQFNQRMLSKKQRLTDQRKADTLHRNDASEAQGWLFEGGDGHALVVFRDDEDEDQDVDVHPSTGIPYDVLGEAMGAREQLQLRRSARNVRDLEEEEFDSADEEMIEEEDDIEYESDG